MPTEDDPKYAAWKPAISREIAELDDRAVLVGHSIGATMLIHALAEEPPKQRIGAILLLSTPFVGDGGWPSDEIAPKPDLGRRLPDGVPVHLIYGSKDETAPSKHAELYAKAIPQAQVHRLPGRDHQLNNDLREVAAVIRAVRAVGPTADGSRGCARG
jgi:pimeloyl-ACP methyl ester carboxylesterase